MTSYVDDYSPGSGRRTAARSWLHSDAPELNLDGDWRFRLLPSHRGLDDAVADPDTGRLRLGRAGRAVALGAGR